MKCAVIRLSIVLMIEYLGTLRRNMNFGEFNSFGKPNPIYLNMDHGSLIRGHIEINRNTLE